MKQCWHYYYNGCMKARADGSCLAMSGEDFVPLHGTKRRCKKLAVSTALPVIWWIMVF